MSRNITITRITVTSYQHEIRDMALEATLGFDTVYQPGSTLPMTGSILTIETSEGISG